MGKLNEYFAISRMCFWVLLGLYVFTIQPSLKQSVALVILLSLYANFGTDFSQYSARRAERRAEHRETPSEE